MCRFTFYFGESLRLSSLVTEPSNSLIHQSFHSHERREPLNGDGFGVAWYTTDETSSPGLFRSTTPAWNNVNLTSLAAAVRSSCILAHVRAATQPDSVSEANCHPFVAGRHAFMHNGQLGGFGSIRRDLLGLLTDGSFDRVRGRTDSECLFALFQDQLGRAGAHASADELADAVIKTFSRALQLAQERGQGHEPSYLNVAVTNGANAVVTRFTTKKNYEGESLYWIHGRRCVCENGLCRMEPTDSSPGTVVISSERLDDDPGWSSVPRNHMVLASMGRRPMVRAIEIGAGQ